MKAKSVTTQKSFVLLFRLKSSIAAKLLPSFSSLVGIQFAIAKEGQREGETGESDVMTSWNRECLRALVCMNERERGAKIKKKEKV